MDERQVNKILKPGMLIHIITAIVALITIGLVGTGAYEEFRIQQEPKSLGELIENNEEKPEQYAKVHIAYLPYGVASEDNEKFYYFVMDEQQFMYIVRMTDETYKNLEAMYNNGEGTVDYEFKGYTFRIPAKLKSLALEAAEEAFENNEMTVSNFENYVGTVYIDETMKPENNTINNLYGVGLIFGFFTIGMIIVSVSQIVRTRKVTKNKELMEELRNELMDLNDDTYKKLKIYLTNKYIIARSGGILAFEYKDIIWEYATVRYVNGTAQGRALMLCTKDKTKYTVAATSANDTAIDEIMAEIKDKNPNVRIGFTQENREFFKNYQKEIV